MHEQPILNPYSDRPENIILRIENPDIENETPELNSAPSKDENIYSSPKLNEDVDIKAGMIEV